MSALTDFQLKILYVLSSGSMYGLGIKDELESYFPGEVNHGRLYPNLDALVKDDYIMKGSIDDRTNKYELTSMGLKEVKKDLEWRLNYFTNRGKDRIEFVEKLISR